MTETLLIVDLGTTGIKAVVFDIKGVLVYECSHPTPVAYGPDSMEIDPEALWSAVKCVCRKAFSDLKNPVTAISMATMAASFIPLDAEGMPLHPAIGWADSRPIPIMREYMESFLSGSRVPGCGQYPLPMYLPFKIEWLSRVRPDLHSRVHTWLNVSEYIYARLGDLREYLTDYSIASRTMLFDIAEKRWNHEALRRFSIDAGQLPRPVPAGTVIGRAGKELCELGCDPDTVIVMGGHDHMCFVPGAGITSDEVMLNTTGTSEALVSLLPPGPYDNDGIIANWLNCEAALQAGRAAVVGYTGMSGRVFQSLEESLGGHGSDAAAPPTETQPVFLPPQRAQLTSVKGELRGMPPIFDRAMLYRAVCDGLYLECRRTMERMAQVRKVGTVRFLRMVGGHCRNEDEVRRKSAVLGTPVEIVRQSNLSSLGAAMVAATGCGLFPSLAAAVSGLFRGDIVRIDPDPALVERFNRIYQENYLPCFADGIRSL